MSMHDYRTMLHAGVTARDIRYGMSRDWPLGMIAWAECKDRENEALHALDGWPQCACHACSCEQPATTTDDGGVYVCGACADYVVDDDGDVICSRCERSDEIETVTECCGAGGQMRTYTHWRAPEGPESAT